MGRSFEHGRRWVRGGGRAGDRSPAAPGPFSRRLLFVSRRFALTDAVHAAGKGLPMRLTALGCHHALFQVCR